MIQSEIILNKYTLNFYSKEFELKYLKDDYITKFKFLTVFIVFSMFLILYFIIDYIIKFNL